MAWTNLNFAVGQILTAAQMNNFFANFAAMMNGDTGAPRLKPLAVLPTVAGIGFTSAISAAERGINSTTPTKTHEIRIPYSGALNIFFELESAVNGGAARAQIYVNGLVKGILRSNNNLGFIGFSEDITGLNVGDLVQLFTFKASGSVLAISRNFTVRESTPNSAYIKTL